MIERVTMLHGNCRDVLRTLPADSVHCCVTSPPYWGLRDYGLPPVEWADGTTCCLGLEPTPEAFIAHTVEVFREVRRVLRKDGTLWLNIGDSYANASSGGEMAAREELTGGGCPVWSTRDGKRASTLVGGLKPKDLTGMPWRIALALQADGWWLRCDVVWSKANPMPESVRDRPTRSHEFVFLLAKSERYFYDADAVREPLSEGSAERYGYAFGGAKSEALVEADKTGMGVRTRVVGERAIPAGRNLRSVWHLPTQPFAEAHFACVDDETEALTPHGWKRQDDLSDDDLIAEYDRGSHTWKWAKATFHRYDYSGELVAIEKRDASQRLTPNHRCIIRRRSGVSAVVRADEVKPGVEIPVAAPGSWTGSSGIGEDWAALVGWFVAEGCIHKWGGVTIYQSETANPRHVETIRGLLARCGVPFKEHISNRTRNGNVSTCIGFYIGTESGRRLLELAPGKKLTPEMTWLPESECNALLSALIAGDGHTRPDGRACIIQKCPESIGMMQLLAMRLGYRAVVSQRSDGQHALYLTRGDWLTLRGTNGTHAPLGREEYKGVVWCPSVPTGFWIARRNGRPFITGNTYPEALVSPCIKAGTSEHGCCWECGAPWRRLVDVETRANISDNNGKHDGSTYRTVSGGVWNDTRTRVYRGWEPTCACGCFYDPVPCTVLDPFGGSGTTALVAAKHGRNAIHIDQSKEYLEIARRRLKAEQPGLLL
jgi:DNA modification methylase